MDVAAENIFCGISWRNFELRKKSHISLARYLVLRSENEELRKHKLAFYLGSILPDCKPSFVYRKHEISGTFDDVTKEMIRLSEEEKAQKNRRAYYRNLGQITHYVADYFTFPHNHSYPGGLSDHCSYEQQLKKELRKYLTGGEADKQKHPLFHFKDAREIADYIKKEHDKYLQKNLNVTEDIYDIVRINYQMLFGILSLSPGM